VSLLGWIVSFTLLGGIVSAAVAATFLLVSERGCHRAMPLLVAFATGALLGAALLGLLPEAFGRAGPDRWQGVGLSILAGIAIFFVLEKLVLWRHCHADDCETHGVGHDHGHGHGHAAVIDPRDRAAGPLMLIGDAVHNLLDGVLIAAAFMTDTSLGILTGIAVMAHEIPSEVGNFAVLLHAGYSRLRALVWNLATSLTSILGGAIGYFALSGVQHVLPYALGVAAACLLYVAVADLIPGLHRRVGTRESVLQVVLMAAGVGVILAVEALAPH
jgi:zinc and cadmium transporter